MSDLSGERVIAASIGVLKADSICFWPGPHDGTRVYVPDKRRISDDPQILASTTAQTIAEMLTSQFIMENLDGEAATVTEVAKTVLEAVYGLCRGVRE